MTLNLFHRTDFDVAKAILTCGFKDNPGNYGTLHEYSGVWLSSVPPGANAGASGDTILLVEVDLSESELDQFEWAEGRRGYREWLVPAALINAYAKLWIIDEDCLLE